jgi:hypothetical protein
MGVGSLLTPPCGMHAESRNASGNRINEFKSVRAALHRTSRWNSNQAAEASEITALLQTQTRQFVSG